MIIQYDNSYEEEVRDLLCELQDYIVSIDKEKYNIRTEEYREKYFKKTMEEISKYQGRMLLYKKENKIVGLVVGLINNDPIDSYDFVVPKRGRITELVVTESARKQQIGKALLDAMEQFLKNKGCEDILLGVFAYNLQARSFYEKNGYHERMIECSKKL